LINLIESEPSSDKEIVSTLGAKLDKREKDAKISGRTADYYFQIIDEARQLEV
jgi:hypothetical protein